MPLVGCLCCSASASGCVSWVDQRCASSILFLSFNQFLPCSRDIPGVHGEVRGEVGCCGIGSSDVVPSLRHVRMKHLGDLRSGFFCPIIPETHVVGIVDHILHDPFPEIIREEPPIHLSLSVPCPKRLGMWCPDKDKIALFGCQHHLIPIDHKHVTSRIPEQIGGMQIRMTDDR